MASFEQDYPGGLRGLECLERENCLTGGFGAGGSGWLATRDGTTDMCSCSSWTRHALLLHAVPTSFRMYASSSERSRLTSMASPSLSLPPRVLGGHSLTALSLSYQSKNSGGLRSTIHRAPRSVYLMSAPQIRIGNGCRLGRERLRGLRGGWRRAAGRRTATLPHLPVRTTAPRPPEGDFVWLRERFTPD
jgi:hypothetical protein